MRYLVRVERKQTWTLEVEAESEEEAKDTADAQALDEPPHDDFSYDTVIVRSY